MATAAEKREIKELAIGRPRDYLKPGDTVYTSIVSVARSGMSRVLKVLIVRNGSILNISYDASRATDIYRLVDGSIRVEGCGFDAGYDVVYSLKHVLGIELRHEWI